MTIVFGPGAPLTLVGIKGETLHLVFVQEGYETGKWPDIPSQ